MNTLTTISGIHTQGNLMLSKQSDHIKNIWMKDKHVIGENQFARKYTTWLDTWAFFTRNTYKTVLDLI